MGVFNLANAFLEKPVKYKWSLNNIYTEIVSHFDEDSSSIYLSIAMMLKYFYENEYTFLTQAYIKNVNGKLVDVSDKFIESVAKYIELFMDFGELLIAVSKEKINISRRLIEVYKDRENLSMELKEVLENFDLIVSSLEVEGEFLIEILDDWSESIEDNIDNENIFEIFRTTEFIKSALNTEYTFSYEIVKKYNEYYNAKKTDYFISLLKEEQDKIELEVLYLLLEKNKVEMVTNSMSIAHAEYLEYSIELEVIPENVKIILDKIYEKKKKTGMVTSLNIIRDELITTTDILKCDTEYLLPLLMKHARLDKKADDVTRRIFKPIIKDNQYISLLLSNKEKFIKVVNSSEDEKNYIKELLLEKNQDEIASAIIVNEEVELKVEE